MRDTVVLTADAANDFRGLDGPVKKKVAKQLKKLDESPHLVPQSHILY